MRTLSELYLDLLAAFDHARVLSTKTPPGWGTPYYGTKEACRLAWARYEMIRFEVRVRTDAMVRAQQFHIDMVMENNLIAEQADRAYEAMQLAAQPNED